jgi:hypothetical protein
MDTLVSNEFEDLGGPVGGDERFVIGAHDHRRFLFNRKVMNPIGGDPNGNHHGFVISKGLA